MSIIEDRLGSWLSAALEDPLSCDEFKADLRDWMHERERANCRLESMRVMLAQANARWYRALEILAGIHGLMTPPAIAVDGVTYQFTPPDAAAQLRMLSERIRAIPDEIAKTAT